jgi:hypothetical protein
MVLSDIILPALLHCIVCHRSQLRNSRMHVTCTLQNWDFRPQREETTLHQFWEHHLENLHDTTVFSLLNCVRSIPKATSPTKSRVSNTFNREKSTTSLLDAALSRKLTYSYPWSAYILDVVASHLRTKRCLFKLENWALTTTGPKAGARAFLCLYHLLWSI